MVLYGAQVPHSFCKLRTRLRGGPGTVTTAARATVQAQSPAAREAGLGSSALQVEPRAANARVKSLTVRWARGSRPGGAIASLARQQPGSRCGHALHPHTPPPTLPQQCHALGGDSLARTDGAGGVARCGRAPPRPPACALVTHMAPLAAASANRRASPELTRRCAQPLGRRDSFALRRIVPTFWLECRAWSETRKRLQRRIQRAERGRRQKVQAHLAQQRQQRRLLRSG